MSSRRYERRRGSGITERIERGDHLNLTDDPTGENVSAFFARLRKMRDFTVLDHIAEIEQRASKLLADAGLPLTEGGERGTWLAWVGHIVVEEDTPLYYAAHIVQTCHLIKRATAHYNLASAIMHSMQLGVLLTESRIKPEWEPLVARARKELEDGRRAAIATHGPPEEQEENRERRRQAFQRHRIKGLSKGDAESAAARECKCSTRTIRAATRGK